MSKTNKSTKVNKVNKYTDNQTFKAVNETAKAMSLEQHSVSQIYKIGCEMGFITCNRDEFIATAKTKFGGDYYKFTAKYNPTKVNGQTIVPPAESDEYRAYKLGTARNKKMTELTKDGQAFKAKKRTNDGWVDGWVVPCYKWDAGTFWRIYNLSEPLYKVER